MSQMVHWSEPSLNMAKIMELRKFTRQTGHFKGRAHGSMGLGKSIFLIVEYGLIVKSLDEID